MAKSFKDIMNTVPVDMTDPDEVTIRNPFGPSNSRGKGSSMIDVSDPNALTLRNPMGKKATAARKAEADKKSKESATAKEIKEVKATKKQSDSDEPIGPNFKSRRARSDGGLRTSYEEPKKQTFGEAFKEAKKAGKDKFTYNGKSYTTETADEKAKAKAADKPTPTGNIGSRTMFEDDEVAPSYKKGGSVKSSASKRADGCAVRGKTRA
jgi:hypothetical protein